MPPQQVCPSPGQSPDPNSLSPGPRGLGWQRLPWEVNARRQAEMQEQSLLSRELTLLKYLEADQVLQAQVGPMEGDCEERSLQKAGRWTKAGVSWSRPHWVRAPAACCSRTGHARGAPSRCARSWGRTLLCHPTAAALRAARPEPWNPSQLPSHYLSESNTCKKCTSSDRSAIILEICD